jgi:amidase
MVIIGRESWQALAQFADDPAMGEDVRARILAGRDHAPERLAAAEAVRQVFSHEVDAALAGVDALVLPTLPSVPPTLAEATDPRAVLPLTRLVRPFNLSGHPAITLPVLTAQGLPAGVQLVGRKGGDAALLALARCLWRGLDTFHAGD